MAAAAALLLTLVLIARGAASTFVSYTALCLAVKDERDDLAEWVSHHVESLGVSSNRVLDALPYTANYVSCNMATIL
jgi:hypothetical protein